MLDTQSNDPAMVENQTQTEQALVENQPSAQDIAQQAVSEAAHESKDQPAERERIQSIRFSEMRAKIERAERERDQALRDLQEKEEKKTKQEEEDLRLAPDEFAEGNITKLHKTVKKLEEKLQKVEQKNKADLAEAKLRAQYKDIDKVVNPETVEELYRQHPEMEMVIKALPDTYIQGAAAYKMIKQFGIYREDNFVQDKERIAKNLAKPRPSQSMPSSGESPLAFAATMQSSLSEDVKEQLRKEMAEAASRLNQTY